MSKTLYLIKSLSNEGALRSSIRGEVCIVLNLMTLRMFSTNKAFDLATPSIQILEPLEYIGFN